MLKKNLFGNSTASNGTAKTISILNYGNNENKNSKCSTTPPSYSKDSSRTIKNMFNIKPSCFSPKTCISYPPPLLPSFKLKGTITLGKLLMPC